MTSPFYPNQPENEECRRFGDYLSGLTDGEGCFCLRMNITRRSPTANFTISLRADDLSILKEIQSYLGCGKIRFRKAKGNNNPLAIYEVRGISSLALTIIPFFSTHPLRAKKARDFQIWKEAVQICFSVWKQPEQLSRKGRLRKWTREKLLRFTALSHELKEIRKYIDGDNIQKIKKVGEYSETKIRKKLFE